MAADADRWAEAATVSVSVCCDADGAEIDLKFGAPAFPWDEQERKSANGWYESGVLGLTMQLRA